MSQVTYDSSLLPRFHEALAKLDLDEREFVEKLLRLCGRDIQVARRYSPAFRLAYDKLASEDSPAALSPCSSASTCSGEGVKGVWVPETDLDELRSPTTIWHQAEAWIKVGALCLCLMEGYRPKGKNAMEQVCNYIRELYAGTYGQAALDRRDEEMNRP